MVVNIRLPRDQIQAFCRRYSVRRMLLFGSALRSNFGPESDIDVLVEFEPGARVTLFDMVEMQDELDVMLGREIDLATPDGLSHYIREDVLARAEVVYERAA